jgi:hypothetical protein
MRAGRSAVSLRVWMEWRTSHEKSWSVGPFVHGGERGSTKPVLPALNRQRSKKFVRALLAGLRNYACENPNLHDRRS